MKKERKVIDAHLHIFGHCEFGDRLAHGIGDEPTQEYLTEKYYGRLGIEKGIVMGNGPLEEQGKNLGEYFYYSAGLDEKDSWLKLEEIESHLQRKRCVGVKLYPGYYELYPNDKSLYPIYKMTEEYGKVLSVHTGMVAGNGGHLKCCRPIHLDDIATDFPGLKIVMCHFGNPFLQEAAAVLEKNPNMYADLSGLIEGAFETETFIKDQSGYLEILKSWMHYVSDYGKFIYGTDWPAVNCFEYRELFELTRLFATRGTQQGFINVISENYLLRDYMLGNAQTFISDPKAIPTIVADYARTERNTILKLIMRMAEEQVSEDEIVDALMVSGIKFEDPLAALKNLIYKHCFIKKINIRIYFREQLMEDALHTEVKKYYAIEEETEIAEYAKKLQNAYYIAEDEQGDKYYIGAKLYGHVFQALIPGQFLTYDGKYYEVQAITPQNGVVVRRAADHITDRVYYRQLRHIRINDWKDDENIGGQKSVEGISIYKGYCEIDIETAGYLEMTSYENLNAAKEVRVSGIPVRSYRNKLVMKLNLPDVSERVRYTLCLLLNEIFRTIYPDAYPYICAVTLVDTNHAPEKLKGAMYTLSGKVDGSAIYIVEDSEIDLGLIASVERNLKRYFEIITEVLMWHEQKMAENPEKESKPEDYETPFTPEAGKEEEAAKKAREKAEKENKRFLGKIKRKLRKFWEKITAGFKKKPKDEPVEETPTEETPTEETPIEETPEEGISEDSPTEETTSTDERNTETGTENVMKNVMYSAEAEMDIEGEDEQLVEQKTTKKTEYQKSCFLKYGYEEIDPYFDFGGTIKYLTKYGYDRNPLQQVRDGVKAAEADNAKYDPHKEGSHFCDFCGVELAGGEYELLKDGRERCNHCSSTALRTGEEFKEVYKMVVRNMEIFFGIKLNVAIKVRMTDAKTIAKHFGDEFVATPGFDGRVLGFAQKDSSGYSLYIENGSPKLAAMATIAHELTHIWQYQNWDEKMILSKYGKQYRLEIYEGMAKWAEIQYLLYLNEISYAKRQEIVTRLRDDEYGRGFIQYAKKYPLAYRHEKNATPFGRIPPL